MKDIPFGEELNVFIKYLNRNDVHDYSLEYYYPDFNKEYYEYIFNANYYIGARFKLDAYDQKFIIKYYPQKEKFVITDNEYYKNELSDFKELKKELYYKLRFC